MRLQIVAPEYRGRVRLRERFFPLELRDGFSAPRDILQQEWWLAALQEPRAEFNPFRGDDWPQTTLPAFDAAWCAFQEGEEVGRAFDLRIRRAFFAEGRNIGRPEVLYDLAREAGLDLAAYQRRIAGGEARRAVLEEARLGRDDYGVRGTPTVMLSTGTRLRHPIAYPNLKGHLIVGVRALPCSGDGCLDATRALFERALQPAA